MTSATDITSKTVCSPKKIQHKHQATRTGHPTTHARPKMALTFGTLLSSQGTNAHRQDHKIRLGATAPSSRVQQPLAVGLHSARGRSRLAGAARDYRSSRCSFEGAPSRERLSLRLRNAVGGHAVPDVRRRSFNPSDTSGGALMLREDLVARDRSSHRPAVHQPHRARLRAGQGAVGVATARVRRDAPSPAAHC